MLEKIVDGIVEKLVNTFGLGYKIYTEQVKQGLVEPCFIISLVNPTSEQFLANRYYQTNLFSIQYIPNDSIDTKTEFYKIHDTLFEALEYINVGSDLQRGTAMKCELVDGVLVFLVNYNMFIYKETENIPMENISIEIKRGDNNGESE